MKPKVQETRDRIRSAAAAVLGERGPLAFTTDQVATQAGCAKGLVHYHFKTKIDLLAAVVEWDGAERVKRFRTALQGSDAIGDSWSAILEERKAGLLQLSGALAAVAPALDRELRRSDHDLAEVLGRAASRLLARDRQVLRVPGEHVGHLLVSLVHGTISQLAAGGDEAVLEDAYATGWLGVLSLGSRR